MPDLLTNDRQVLSRCPVCRARLRDALECSRCGSNLEKVRQVAQRANELEGVAIALLVADDLAQAQQTLRAARQLRRSRMSSVLLLFIKHELYARQPLDRARDRD